MTNKSNTIKASRRLCYCAILVIFPLITAFSFSTPTWKKINNRIAKKFPEVQNITTEELAQTLDKEKRYLYDVRPAEEYAVSSIAGAINIESVTNVKASKDEKIVVFCSVGYRSAEFARQLQRAGYTRVYNLSGSIFEWANKGYPLFRGASQTNFVHPFNDDWGKLLDERFHSYTPVISEKDNNIDAQ